MDIEFGLKKEIIDKVRAVLSQFPQITEAILYGSRALGTYKPGSDIDLTFKGDLLNNQIINKISLALDELYLAYTFDLSVYDHINNPDLLEHIGKHGVRFWGERGQKFLKKLE